MDHILDLTRQNGVQCHPAGRGMRRNGHDPMQWLATAGRMQGLVDSHIRVACFIQNTNFQCSLHIGPRTDMDHLQLVLNVDWYCDVSITSND